MEGRVPMIEIILDTNALEVQPMQKFVKIQIERLEKDGNDQENGYDILNGLHFESIAISNRRVY